MPNIESAKLIEIWKTFDVNNAEATEDADRVRILAEIGQADGGATQVNLQVKRALVDSARYEAEHTLATGVERARILTKAGDFLKANGQYRDAELMHVKALASRARVLGADHPSTVDSVNNLALCVDAQGKRAEAETMFRQALADRTRILGVDHPDTISSRNDLAICLGAQGKRAEQEPLYRQVLASRTRVLSNDHPNAVDSVSNLAVCLGAQGKAPE